MSRLSELLNEANTANLSARSLARSAQEAGFSLNHDTAARYLRGDHGQPDEATLRALSKVLIIPMTRLRAAAALPADATEPYRPPDEASRLSRRQRRAIDEIIRAMLAPMPESLTELETHRAQRDPTLGSARPATRATSRGSAAAKRGSAAARRGSAEPPVPS